MTDKDEIKNKLATTPFGDGQEIKELAHRLEVTSLIPGTSKLTQKESLLLAQVAVAHKLDPFNGEVWLIKNKDTGEVYGTMIGIKGLRKKARQQIEKIRGGSYSITYRDIEGEERIKYIKDDSSIVIESTLTDSETGGSWLLMYAKMRSCKMDDDAVIKRIGEMPSVKGIGIYTPGKDRSKMNPYLVARKRAEADAIKQRFDVPFGLEYSESLDELPSETSDPAIDPFADVIDGEIIDDDPFEKSGRPFSAPDLLNALETYSGLLPDDVIVEKEEAEIIQKAIINSVGGKIEVYGKISQYLTKCVAIPAAPPRIIRAIQHWANPKDNPNGNTATITGMAIGELALLVSYLKDK